jgi:hypothetical protein
MPFVPLLSAPLGAGDDYAAKRLVDGAVGTVTPDAPFFAQ